MVLNQLVYAVVKVRAVFHRLALISIEGFQSMPEYLEVTVRVDQEAAEKRIAGDGDERAVGHSYDLMNVRGSEPNGSGAVVR